MKLLLLLTTWLLFTSPTHGQSFAEQADSLRGLLKAGQPDTKRVIKKRPADKDDVDCRMAVASYYLRLYGSLRRQFAQTQNHQYVLENMLTMNLEIEYQLYLHSVLIPYYVASKQYHKAQLYLIRNEPLCDKAFYAKEVAINYLWWFKNNNGIGLPADLNPSRSRTLGMSQIRGMSKQLGGSLQINSTNGVQISLTFTEENRSSGVSQRVESPY